MDLGDKIQKMIDEHGWTEFEPDAPTFDCAVCEDRFQIRYNVPVDHPSFGKMFPCPACRGGQELVDRKVKARFTEAQLPKNYQTLTFDTWHKLSETEKNGKRLALACCELFVETPSHMVSLAAAFKRAGRDPGDDDVVRNSLILQGAPGLGKTGMAAAVMNALLTDHKSVLYIRTQDFVEALKQSFDQGKDKDSESTQSILETVKRHPRLILDEFNMNIESAWRKEMIESVVRYRYGNSLPTIFTCNADEDELEVQWGERTTAVLFAMAHYVPMGGFSLRNIQQNKEAF